MVAAVPNLIRSPKFETLPLNNSPVRTTSDFTIPKAAVVPASAKTLPLTMSGDIVKGSVFALAGTTAAFGIVKSDVVLTGELFSGRVSNFGLRIRFGTAATI